MTWSLKLRFLSSASTSVSFFSITAKQGRAMLIQFSLLC
jgi:hypothetical protein